MMLAVYALLSSLIEPICTCFVGHYPTEEKKVYPYVEIKFPTSVPNNSFSDNNLLQVDIWDDKDTDIRDIEGITDLIYKQLNKLHHTDNVMQLSIYRDRPYRLEIIDEMIGIQRRQLRYVCKVYKIEE